MLLDLFLVQEEGHEPGFASSSHPLKDCKRVVISIQKGAAQLALDPFSFDEVDKVIGSLTLDKDKVSTTTKTTHLAVA
jgi:hypothetical protein